MITPVMKMYFHGKGLTELICCKAAKFTNYASRITHHASRIIPAIPSIARRYP
ncbi:hypothetical protein QUF80_01830 [Desulfococcaceae bacterium HSG8]|nr:hypothetical protein [Desulfococcaceae bacterium HSG8]